MGNDMFNHEQLADAEVRAQASGIILSREAFLRRLHVLADTVAHNDSLLPSEVDLSAHDAALRAQVAAMREALEAAEARLVRARAFCTAAIAKEHGYAEDFYVARDILSILEEPARRPNETEVEALCADLGRYIAKTNRQEGALKWVAERCPCGARPESPQTHPHVTGCPVDAALARAAEASPSASDGGGGERG